MALPSPSRGRFAALACAVTVIAAANVAPAGAATMRLSLGPGTAQGSGDSARPSISADGRYVAFESRAPNLAPGDTNADVDVFIRDRTTGRTSLASVDSAGRQLAGATYYPSLSADGRYIAFLANTAPRWTTPWDAYVHDRVTGATVRVSDAPNGTRQNASGSQVVISGDGRHVAFVSEATNLDQACGPPDFGTEKNVFVHDLNTHATRCVSATAGTAQGGSSPYSEHPSLSFNGRYVAFSSGANLVTSDANGNPDVFVNDTWTGHTSMASVNSDGSPFRVESHGASLSADGRTVAFYSGDNRYVGDVAVHDMSTGITTRLGAAHSGVYNDSPALSPDGRFLAFESWATGLVPDGTPAGGQVYLHDLATRRTVRVSAGPNGRGANSRSTNPVVSAGGHVTAFESVATDLVPADTNGAADVFARVADPEVSVRLPRPGGRYLQGSHVRVSYTCAAPSDGFVIASCRGTQWSGVLLATARPGRHAFSVTAVDVAGNKRVRSFSYVVVARRVGIGAGPARTRQGSVAIVVSCRSQLPAMCRGELRLNLRGRAAGHAAYAVRAGRTVVVRVRLRHTLPRDSVVRAAPDERDALVRPRDLRLR